jgi:heat shock protein HtpX
LFIATNIAVLVVLSIVLRLFGVESLLAENGVDLNYNSLLIFSAVFGMGGAFISLAMSKWIAKRSTGAVVITEPSNQTEQWLLNKVSQHAQAAGIQMPEVAIFDSPSPNAFATGARRDAALVAVSTGLLRNMREGEVDAVLGHEIGHVANGDMVTLTLVQGVVNTFVIFLSRVVGHFVDRVILKNERGYGIGYMFATLAAQVLFGILASFVVCWVSRQREFRADEAGARLAGRGNMIAALERLKTAGDGEPLPDALQAFGISGGGGVMALLASHPPLDARIEALRQGT